MLLLRGEVSRCWACPEEEVGCSQCSWGCLCRGELVDFLPAEGKTISVGSGEHHLHLKPFAWGESTAVTGWFLVSPPTLPAVTSFLNQKRTLFPERALLAAPTCRSQRSWSSLWCPWQAGQEEGTEFLGGRVEGLFLHPVPTSHVGLQVHCLILGGERDSSSVSCDRAEFCCRVYKNLPPSSQSSLVPQFCELSLAS